MTDSLDELLRGLALPPPEGFATRVTELARRVPQSRPPLVRIWQWASLAAGAGIGALLLGEFAFSAFSAMSAL